MQEHTQSKSARSSASQSLAGSVRWSVSDYAGFVAAEMALLTLHGRPRASADSVRDEPDGRISDRIER